MPHPPVTPLPVLLAVLLALPLGTGCYALGDGRGTLGIFGDRDPRVVYAVETDQPAVALTIDDGPDAETTGRILDVLAAHGARATFFVTSERVAGNEGLVDAIVAGGHELGNHHKRDVPSISLSPGDFEQELLEAHAVLSVWTEPHWFRPASAWYHDWMLDILDAHEYRAALGSVYPLDAQIPSVRLASWWIRRHAQAGSVIVLHDGGARGERSAQVLERVLPVLAERGIAVVTLSELLERGGSEAPVPAGAGSAARRAPGPGDFPGKPVAWPGKRG